MLNTQALITQNYYLEQVANKHYLVDKHSGHISSLNDSAAVIINMLMSGMSPAQIGDTIAASTGQNSDEIATNIAQLLTELTPEKPAPNTNTHFKARTGANHSRQPISIHYLVNHCPITIRYGSAEAYRGNHALLAPMQTETAAPNAQCIDIYSDSERVDIYLNGRPYLGCDDSSWLNGLLRSCLIAAAYGQLRDALVLHAAGVSKHQRTLLFAGPSGAGKSTLTSHLLGAGFDYLGDDNIPIDMHTNCAFALPMAISLKQGSWAMFEHFQAALDTSPIHREFDKPMKTFAPEQAAIETQPTQITALVFSHYNRAGENQLKPVDLDTALGLIQQAETKFNPDTISHTPKALLHWLSQVPTYTLRYNSLDYATQCAMALLSNASVSTYVR